MSRARRRTASPFSLFPFLAVLVSTMGALILLLLAINRQAALRAIQTAIGSLVRRADSEADELQRRRVALLREVSAREDQLASIHRDQRSVGQQLQRADNREKDRAARLAAMKTEFERLLAEQAKMESETAAVRQQLDELAELRARLAADHEHADRTVVPVAHPGSNGTVRQPIYIECTADSVIIQPEGIALSPRDVTPDDDGQSALARAVRALSEYFRQPEHTAPKPGNLEDSRAYPLLLVRPDGIAAYYAARTALEPLDLPFGYELIDADWLLRYPEPDPQVRVLVLAAMEPPPARPDKSAFAGFAASRRGGRPPVTGAPKPDDRLGAASPMPHRALEMTDHPAGDRRGTDGTADPKSPPPAAVPVAKPQRASPRPTTDTDSTSTAQAEPNDDRKSDAASPPRLAESETTGDGIRSPRAGIPAGLESRGKIAIPRTIQVDCTAAKLVVWPSRREVPTPETAPNDEVISRLNEAIEREVASWGPAGTTFRWQPQLVCRVMPDGLETFYGLRLALAGSQLGIEHELALDSEPDLIATDRLLDAQRSTLGAQRIEE